MKKAIAVILVGVALIVAAAFMGGLKTETYVNAQKNYNKKMEMYEVPVKYDFEYEITDFDKIDFDISSDSVIIKYSTEAEKITLSYYEKFKDQFTTSVQEGTLSVVSKSKLTIMGGLDWLVSWLKGNNQIESKIFLTIPSGKNFSDIKIDISSGSLDFDLNADSIAINLSSGSAKIKDVTAKDFSFKSSSGSLNVSQIVCDSFNGKLSSGSAVIKDIAVANDFSFTSSSGSFTSENFSAQSSYIKLSSGSANLKNFVSPEFKYESSSGSFTATDLSSNKSDIKLSSGSCYLTNFSSAEFFKFVSYSGSLVMKEIDVKEADIHISSGRTQIDNGTLDKLTLKSSSGRVLVSNVTFDSDWTINVSSGSANFNLDKSLVDSLAFDLSASSGTVRVLDEKKSDKFTKVSAGAPLLKVHSGSGSITISALA